MNESPWLAPTVISLILMSASFAFIWSLFLLYQSFNLLKESKHEKPLLAVAGFGTMNILFSLPVGVPAFLVGELFPIYIASIDFKFIQICFLGICIPILFFNSLYFAIRRLTFFRNYPVLFWKKIGYSGALQAWTVWALVWLALTVA